MKAVKSGHEIEDGTGHRTDLWTSLMRQVMAGHEMDSVVGTYKNYSPTSLSTS